MTRSAHSQRHVLRAVRGMQDSLPGLGTMVTAGPPSWVWLRVGEMAVSPTRQHHSTSRVFPNPLGDSVSGLVSCSRRSRHAEEIGAVWLTTPPPLDAPTSLVPTRSNEHRTRGTWLIRRGG